MNQNPKSVPALLHDKYEFFAELAARFRAQTQLEAVLVGGSAFEWHFPSLLHYKIQERPSLSSFLRRSSRRLLYGWVMGF